MDIISALNADPVGEVKKTEQVEGFVEELKRKWDEVKDALGDKGRVSLVYVTKFLLGTLDGLIVFVDALLSAEKGEDKKATVIAAVVVLYDYIVAQAIPFWLKPFANSIKYFIIYTVISVAIDWIVSKYREGAWSK
ncbi:MAG: hypothetical protein DWQ19_11870 [Crenarchaeota archaeon]|nr:MAG: hypothetical protein DWQ19_11870 [Thermoproteota archaeon]